MLYIVKIKNSARHIGAGALIIVNKCILDLFGEVIQQFIYYILDENSNLSSSGTAILRFDILQSLENYIKFVYYDIYPLTFFKSSVHSHSQECY